MRASTFATITHEFDVLDVFAHLLINGDRSSLTPSESADFSSWLEIALSEGYGNERYGHWTLDDSESNEFGRCDITGLRGSTVRLQWVDIRR